MVLGTGVESQDGPCHQGQGSLGPDHQLGEVIAACRLHELAPGDEHLAGAEHGLDAEHVVAGHAVLDRPHPPGIGGHVAAQAGRLLPGEHRIDEARRQQGCIELGQGDTGLDDGHMVGQVDLEDPVHPFEGHHHATLDGDGAPESPVPDPRATRGVCSATATFTMAATSSVLAGRTTAKGTTCGAPRASSWVTSSSASTGRSTLATPTMSRRASTINRSSPRCARGSWIDLSSPVGAGAGARDTSSVPLSATSATRYRAPSGRPGATGKTGAVGRKRSHRRRSPGVGCRAIGGVNESVGPPGVGEIRAGRLSRGHGAHKRPVGQVLVEDQVLAPHPSGFEVPAPERGEVQALCARLRSVDGQRVLGCADDEVAGALHGGLFEEDLEAALLTAHDAVEHRGDGPDHPAVVLDLGDGDVLHAKAEERAGAGGDGGRRAEEVDEEVAPVDGVLEQSTASRLTRIGAPRRVPVHDRPGGPELVLAKHVAEWCAELPAPDQLGQPDEHGVEPRMEADLGDHPGGQDV